MEEGKTSSMVHACIASEGTPSQSHIQSQSQSQSNSCHSIQALSEASTDSTRPSKIPTKKNVRNPNYSPSLSTDDFGRICFQKNEVMYNNKKKVIVTSNK